MEEDKRKGGEWRGLGETPVTTNTINQIVDYLSLAPFFYSALLSVSSQEESSDDSQGMAVALMDLIDGALGGCQRPGRPTSFCSPTEACTGYAGQAGTGFPYPAAFDSDDTMNLPSAGRRLLTLRSVEQ